MYNEQDVIDTTIAETTEQVAEETSQTEEIVQEEQQTVQVQAQQETDQAKNWRAMREAKDKAERERDEMVKILQQAYGPAKSQAPVQQEEEFHIAPDDIVEGKHLSKVDKKIKHLEQQLQTYQQQSQQSVLEARIKAQYPDFDSVVSNENIEVLKAAHPEIAQTLITSTDIYSKAVSAYKMIKQLGIYQDPANFQQDVLRAQKNSAKPKPLASVSPQQGDSPLSRANAFANGLTDDLKKQLYKEMVDAAKNR